MVDVGTVCVGTNFSPESEAALQSAASMARAFGAKVAIVTVVEPVRLYQRILTAGESRFIPTDQLAARAAERLQQTVTAPPFSGLAVDYQVHVGVPFADLIAAARMCHADLLVVGTRRRSEIEHLFLGSTAERVLRKSPMLVLVAKAALTAPQVILAPTDFSDASRPAVEYAADLARRWAARLVMLHVIEPITETYVWPGEPATAELFVAEPEELEPEWQSLLEAVNLGDVRHEHRTVKGYAVPSIAAAAREMGVDLIVMGTHGRTGLMHALLGSVAERVVREADCPVLTVHPKEFRSAMP